MTNIKKTKKPSFRKDSIDKILDTLPKRRQKPTSKKINIGTSSKTTVQKMPKSLLKYNFENNKGKKLKIGIVGGAEEIGRNMTFLEYDNDIVIIDMGLQFPEESMLGIDYIIPDVSYFKGKENRIKGVIITHGHFDHIGGIPHIMPQIGNPPMFMGKLTAALVRNRQQEFKHTPDLKITEIDETTKIRLGNNFNVEFFRVNHTIPDSFGIALYTPVGLVIHSGDMKIDFKPMLPDQPANLAKYASLGSQGVLALLLDSTNADLPGYQVSESDVKKDLEKLFTSSLGRIIVGTFASQISRIQILLELSKKYGRKVVFEGRSMVSNVEACHQLGYLHNTKGQIIETEEASRVPDNKLLIVGTGAQGQDKAFLMRLANNEHRHFSLKKGDTVIFSSSVIPGNERTVQTLKDTLCKKGAKVIHSQTMDVHAGGHSKKEDLKLIIRLMRPRYFIPSEANRFKLEAHAEIAREVGIPENRILIPKNGQFIEFSRNTGEIINKNFPTEYVFVDGLGVDDVNHVVLRDRQLMAEDGMFVVIATVRRKTGALVGSPDIISRGFVYMKENRTLIEQTRNKVKKILNDKDPDSGADETYIKAKIRNEIGQFLYAKTKRRPMVLPVVIEV